MILNMKTLCIHTHGILPYKTRLSPDSKINLLHIFKDIKNSKYDS